MQPFCALVPVLLVAAVAGCLDATADPAETLPSERLPPGMVLLDPDAERLRLLAGFLGVASNPAPVEAGLFQHALTPHGPAPTEAALALYTQVPHGSVVLAASGQYMDRGSAEMAAAAACEHRGQGALQEAKVLRDGRTVTVVTTPDGSAPAALVQELADSIAAEGGARDACAV